MYKVNSNKMKARSTSDIEQKSKLLEYSVWCTLILKVSALGHDTWTWQWHLMEKWAIQKMVWKWLALRFELARNEPSQCDCTWYLVPVTAECRAMKRGMNHECVDWRLETGRGIKISNSDFAAWTHLLLGPCASIDDADRTSSLKFNLLMHRKQRHRQSPCQHFGFNEKSMVTAATAHSTHLITDDEITAFVDLVRSQTTLVQQHWRVVVSAHFETDNWHFSNDHRMSITPIWFQHKISFGITDSGEWC